MDEESYSEDEYRESYPKLRCRLQRESTEECHSTELKCPECSRKFSVNLPVLYSVSRTFIPDNKITLPYGFPTGDYVLVHKDSKKVMMEIILDLPLER